MASIKIDSKIVVEACDSLAMSIMRGENMHFYSGREAKMVDNIRDLAEYSTDSFIYIDHNDFQLIGEYLPKFNKTTIKG